MLSAMCHWNCMIGKWILLFGAHIKYFSDFNWNEVYCFFVFESIWIVERDRLVEYLCIRSIWRMTIWIDWMDGGVIEIQHDFKCSTVGKWLIYLSLWIIFVDIDRDETANGFRVSNPSIHQCAALAASLEVEKNIFF